MDQILETARLRLRPLDVADADWIARDIARPEVHRWLTSPPFPYGRDDALEWIFLARDAPAHFVIQEAGQSLGIISLDDELGFWLRPSAWGRGVITEAAVAVLRAHFLQNTTPVRSGYVLGNAASARVQDRLGFKPAQTEQRHSHFHADTIVIQVTYLSQDTWQATARNLGLEP